MAQTHYSPYTVQAAQVPSTQTDFPVLVSVTDNRLRTIANGGNVADANGYDIRPYADAALTSALSYQLEAHGSSTGNLVMRVKVPSLANGSIIYIGYGDSALNTDGSSTGVWDSDYILKWWCDDVSGGAVDATANGNDGTDTNGPTYSVAAKINTGIYFDASNRHISVTGLSLSGDCTISYWFDTADVAGSIGRFSDLAQAAATGINIAFEPTTGIVSLDNSGGPTSTVASGSGFNDGAPHFLAITRSGTTYTYYLDGSTIGTSGGTAPTYTRLFIGVEQSLAGYSDVLLDEVSVSSAARSANWLTTEYNNQSAPGTFAVLGSEVEVGAGVFVPQLRGPIQSNLIWR